MKRLLGPQFQGIPQAVDSVQVDIQNSLRILNDEKATINSNGTNKATLLSQYDPI